MNAENDAELTLIAEAIRYATNVLGTGNATTSMGAIELVAKETKGGSECLAESLFAVATALEDIAMAIRETRGP